MERSTIVLITGANAGLGFQMVRALYGSDEDYNILLGGRSLEKAEQAANAIKQEFPSTHSKIYPIQIDIEDDDSIQRAFNEVAGKFGRLDALVNNAGMSHTFHPATEREAAWLNLHLGALLDPQIQTGALTMRQAWTASWTINTVGTQIVTATFMPLLLKSDNPRLLFLASGTSTLAGTENLNSPLNKVPAKGWPKTTATAFNNNIAAYRSAKCGMNMMMRGM